MAARSVLAKLVPAASLPPKLEPYKKLLGVLVRQNCVSVAISNPYLNLSEPVGAVMLRDVGGGNLKLPARSFLRLLAGEQQQLAGFVLAYEVQHQPDTPLLSQAAGHAQSQQLQQQQQEQERQQQPAPTQSQESAAAQVQAALECLRPGLLGGWYGGWSQEDAGASCRILPPAGPSAATATTADAAGVGSVGSAAASIPSDSSSSSNIGQDKSPAAAVGASSSQQQQPVCSLGQQFLQTYLDSLGSLNTFG